MKDPRKEYEARLQKDLLPALQRHCTDCDCSACPYHGLDACTNYMLDLLPDRLRFYGTDLCLDLADNLELCQKYDYDTCSTCKYFSDCYVEEDSTFILKDVYNHLVDLGVYSKRYNMFNYSITWLGIASLIVSVIFIVQAAVFLFPLFIGIFDKFYFRILLAALFVLCAIKPYKFSCECINEGRIKAYRMCQDYIIGRERKRSL